MGFTFHATVAAVDRSDLAPFSVPGWGATWQSPGSGSDQDHDHDNQGEDERRSPDHDIVSHYVKLPLNHSEKYPLVVSKFLELRF
jgi:hypothetical protein